MPGKVKVNGAWKDVPEVYTKVNGAWKTVIEAHTKVNGTWRLWFELAGAVSIYWNTLRTSQRGLQELNFATETFGSLFFLPDTTSNSGAWAQPGVAGYFARANAADQVYKVDFATKATSTAWTFANSVNGTKGMSDSSGGNGYFSRPDNNEVFKIPYATLTQTGLSNWTGVRNSSQLSNPGVKGYSFLSNGRYELTYATDARSGFISTSGIDSQDASAFSEPGVYAFLASGGGSNQAYKWTYSTSSFVAKGSIWSGTPPEDGNGGTNPTVAGYISRANSSTGMFRIAIPTDTVSVLSSTFDSLGPDNQGACSDSSIG